MKTSILFLVPCILLFTTCSLLDSNKEPERPDILGKLVFSADDENGTSQIFTMNANGSGLRKLTNFKNGNDANAPSWHPSGERIIFSSFKQGLFIGPALWVMNANGGNQRVLYDPEPENLHVFPLLGNNARWSPDGSKVTFDMCPGRDCNVSINYEIYVFDTVTKSLTRLTDHPGMDIVPMWSPDGKHIAFGSSRNYNDISYDLYSINVETKELRKLATVGRLGFLQWTASDKIVFTKSNEFTKAITIFSLDLNTNQTTSLISDLNVNLLWTLAIPPRKELLVINKKSDQLPVTFSLYDDSGKLIEQYDFNNEALKTGLYFDWISTTD